MDERWQPLRAPRSDFAALPRNRATEKREGGGGVFGGRKLGPLVPPPVKRLRFSPLLSLGSVCRAIQNGERTKDHGWSDCVRPPCRPLPGQGGRKRPNSLIIHECLHGPRDGPHHGPTRRWVVNDPFTELINDLRRPLVLLRRKRRATGWSGPTAFAHMRDLARFCAIPARLTLRSTQRPADSGAFARGMNDTLRCKLA